MIKKYKRKTLINANIKTKTTKNESLKICRTFIARVK